VPIEKVSASQFAEQIQLGILDRDRTWDVYVGEIPDLVVNPHAAVLERQNDRTRKLSLMMTLSNPDEFAAEYEIDLDGIVYNEGMTRSQGSQATANLTFSRSTPPSADLRVQRGYPVATLPDESTGQTITFVVTEERTMPVATASSYLNIDTNRYELRNVPVVAVIEGSDGRVGPRRITRPLRPLLGFDSVTNEVAASGGRDKESNAELIDRYLISILGRRLTTNDGAKKATIDDFPSVEDALVVGGTSGLITRAGDTAGAVDAYIVGSETLESVENPTYLGAGQLIQVEAPPITEVLSVQDLSTGATPFTEGTDYEVVYDETGVAKSSRAVEGIRFLFTGSAPTIGNPVTITYTYNNLIRRLQTSFELDDRKSEGRDLLYKEGTEVPIALEALLVVESGFNTDTVQTAVVNAIDDFINNTLKLGDDVEESDIQGVVRQISGVDNFIFNRLSRLAVTSGVGDIEIEVNEYATIDAGDLQVST
jgi:uncharacterized phage protein gp47/JayE